MFKLHIHLRMYFNTVYKSSDPFHLFLLTVSVFLIVTHTLRENRSYVFGFFDLKSLSVTSRVKDNVKHFRCFSSLEHSQFENILFIQRARIVFHNNKINYLTYQFNKQFLWLLGIIIIANYVNVRSYHYCKLLLIVLCYLL